MNKIMKGSLYKDVGLVEFLDVVLYLLQLVLVVLLPAFGAGCVHQPHMGVGLVFLVDLIPLLL